MLDNCISTHGWDAWPIQQFVKSLPRTLLSTRKCILLYLGDRAENLMVQMQKNVFDKVTMHAGKWCVRERECAEKGSMLSATETRLINQPGLW